MLYPLDFSVLLLGATAVFKFSSLEIFLSSITLTVNSHADNNFYKYIHLFQILYSMRPVSLLKVPAKV